LNLSFFDGGEGIVAGGTLEGEDSDPDQQHHEGEHLIFD
jgi:hypothetical protein